MINKSDIKTFVQAKTHKRIFFRRLVFYITNKCMHEYINV